MNTSSRIPADGNGVESGASQESELARVLDAYLAAIEAGQAIEPTALAAAHPAIAERLLACLSVLQVAGQVEGRSGNDAALESPGETCLGDFRMLRVIGRGGMGIVFEAEQVSLHRKVALKVLPFAAALHPQQLRRFQIEAQAAAQLHHTNIVPIFSVGCERGVHFYAMQYIEGQTLAGLIHDLRALAGLEGAPDAPRDGSNHHAPRDVPRAPAPAAHEAESGPGVPTDGRSHHAPRDGSESQAPPAHDRPRYETRPTLQAPLPPPDDSLAAEILTGLFAAQPGAAPPRPDGERGAEGRVRGPVFPGRAYFRTAANLALQAAGALDHAHRQAIIHRDIKPANLLVDVRGNLWITDFGLARMQADSSLTMTGDIVGTLRYSSPEQATPGRAIVDHRTDVYSLGATLYELLTLHPVHDGTTRAELLHNLTFAEPKPPRAWNPAIPRDLETIVLKALVKDVQGRYASALDLAHDLRRFLEGRPIQARRPSVWKRVVKWCRRHKVLASSAIVILILAAASATVITAQASKNRALQQENQRRERLARHAQYVQDIRQAFQFVRQGHLREAISVLSRHRPAIGEQDERSFPWYYLWRLCHDQPARTLEGHERAVYNVEYSPNGKKLASCGKDGAIRLWDAATGLLMRMWRAHDGDANYVTFSPDGRTLATGGDDGAVLLWDADTGKPLRPLGRHADWVTCVLFTPDGRHLVSGGRGGIMKSWEIATGKEQTFPSRSLPAAGISMAISRDSQTLVTGGPNASLQFWDPATAVLKRSIPIPFDVRSVAFSHDGKFVATGGLDRTVRVWDAQNGHLENTFVGHSGAIGCVTFSPDDRTLGSCADDGSASVWNRSWNSRVAVYRGDKDENSYGVLCGAFSPDGRILATGANDGCVRLWDLSDGQDRVAIPRPGWYLGSLDFSPDDKMVFSGDGKKARIFAWDSVNAGIHEIDTTRVHDPVKVVAQLSNMSFHRGVFSPDGKMLATTGSDGFVRLWDAATAPKLRCIFEREITKFHADGDPRKPPTVMFSPTGKYLAIGREKAGILLWDTHTGEERSCPRPALWHMEFVPNSNTILYSNESGFAYWDVDAGTIRPTRADGPYSVKWLLPSFSVDGRRIAAAQPDGSIRIWNASTLELEALLLGQDQPPSSLAWSPDGRVLASAGRDRTIRLWDVATGLELGILDEVPREDIHSDRTLWNLQFSPDGSILGGHTGKPEPGYYPVIFWDAPRDAGSHE
ncbi:MAG: protein kinase domain-containing protein [Isosphaeraceae bacterium]